MRSLRSLKLPFNVALWVTKHVYPASHKSCSLLFITAKFNKIVSALRNLLPADTLLTSELQTASWTFTVSILLRVGPAVYRNIFGLQRNMKYSAIYFHIFRYVWF